VRNFLPVDMSEVILKLVPKKNGVRTSAVQAIRMHIYLFIAILVN
jgi:hypothetical protein